MFLSAASAAVHDWSGHWEVFLQDALRPHVAHCSVSLFFAGLLCSASGISAGGVHVVLLMAVGGLSPHDAVPLSKAVAFLGAMSSLLVRDVRRAGCKSGVPIDFDTCRVVVPAALLGTFIGVLCNFQTPDTHVVALLAALLGFTTILVVRTAWEQHCDATSRQVDWTVQTGLAGAAHGSSPIILRGPYAVAPQPSATSFAPFRAAPPPDNMLRLDAGDARAVSSDADSDGLLRGVWRRPSADLERQPKVYGAVDEVVSGSASIGGGVKSGRKDDYEALECDAFLVMDHEEECTRRPMLRQTDVVMALALLFIVVSCGVLRVHIFSCRGEQSEGGGKNSVFPCSMAATWLGGSLKPWVDDERAATYLICLVTGAPLVFFSAMAWKNWRTVASFNRSGTWSSGRILLFQAVAVAAGVFSALVGVGAGLFMSPFFILMGMEPSVASVTSSTCVLFTSASTTMQYACTNRLTMNLALVYGLVTTVASYLGTLLEHRLKDRPRQRSYVSVVVAAVVGASLGALAVHGRSFVSTAPSR